MTQNIILFGSGVVSQCCLAYFGDNPAYNILGVVVDDKYSGSLDASHQKITKFSDVSNVFDTKNVHFIPCIGYSNLNSDRKDVFKRILTKGWKIGNLVGPDFSKKYCSIGMGNIIFPKSNIQPYCTIGDSNVIWPGALIGHHSNIGNFCWLTSNCNIGGHCSIGDQSFIGMNASISNNVEIGSQNILGLDTCITKSTSDGVVKLVGETSDHRLSAEAFTRLTKFGI